MYTSSFFFSSRRRHTRCYRDWSSDVCSSDLRLPAPGLSHRAPARGDRDGRAPWDRPHAREGDRPARRRRRRRRWSPGLGPPAPLASRSRRGHAHSTPRRRPLDRGLHGHAGARSARRLPGGRPGGAPRPHEGTAFRRTLDRAPRPEAGRGLAALALLRDARSVGIPLTESRPLTPPTIAARLAALDWPHLERSLDDEGYAHTPPVLSAEECAELTALYDDDRRFRSRVDMARHRFGLGDYKYFQRPLPRLVQDLRTHAYPYLAAIANRWMAALGREGGFPLKLEAFLETCAAHGQTEPTPLLLHYEAGGYNCLHQDLYGDVAFPLQITAFLTRPRADADPTVARCATG